jgi:hypothetical protein
MTVVERRLRDDNVLRNAGHLVTREKHDCYVYDLKRDVGMEAVTTYLKDVEFIDMRYNAKECRMAYTI